MPVLRNSNVYTGSGQFFIPDPTQKRGTKLKLLFLDSLSTVPVANYFSVTILKKIGGFIANEVVPNPLFFSRRFTPLFL
jgi:hypothetical protein